MDMLTDKQLQSLRNLGNEAEEAADEIERLRAEVTRLTEKVVGMDVVGLAYEQRELPGPFGNADTIGSPAALLRDLGA